MTAPGDVQPSGRFDAVALARALRKSLDEAPDDHAGRLRLVREFVRTAQDDTTTVEEVQLLVAVEPPPVGDRRWDALVAAAAEWVAVKLGDGAVPAWTGRPSRFLDAWWHAEQGSYGRACALAHAPAAFRRRGVLLDPLGLVSDGIAL